jgi:hypothetical protein
MKRILITLLLAIGVLGSIGGHLYCNGLGLFDWFGRLQGQIAPVTIADNTKNYSVIQRAQLENSGKLPMPTSEAELTNWAAHSEDKAYVPPSISYVRVEYLASQVEKPYPKIFFAEQSFPTDTMMLENVAIVKQAAMTKILSSADNLSCEANSGTLSGRSDQVEVLMRPANRPLKRCLLSIKAGCRYLTRLRRLTYELKGEASEHLLPGLQSRLACPASLLP